MFFKLKCQLLHACLKYNKDQVPNINNVNKKSATLNRKKEKQTKTLPIQESNREDNNLKEEVKLLKREDRYVLSRFGKMMKKVTIFDKLPIQKNNLNHQIIFLSIL